MWDEDRQDDGSFSHRGPFAGTYQYLSRDKLLVTTGWNGYRAELTILSPNELKHDANFGMRSGVTFRRLENK